VDSGFRRKNVLTPTVIPAEARTHSAMTFSYEDRSNG